MTMTGTLIHGGMAASLLFLAGCSTTPWSKRQSTTTKLFEGGVRYGSIAAGGAAGYLAGQGLGLDPAASAGLGVLAGAGMYAFNVYGDKGKQQAYDSGLADGANEARAEIVRAKWTREAVYGMPPEGQAHQQLPKTRRVYVPTRDVNGVLMQGGYQEVQYYP